MSSTIRTIALIWVNVLTATLLSATSIIPFTNLGELTAFSECVVLARAVELIETAENGSIFQDIAFESIELTKGALLPGTIFSIRPFSRQTGDFKMDIAGDFKPVTGKTYLLFLNRKGEYWQPLMLSYYVFEQFQKGDDQFLVPIGGAGMEVITRPDGLPVELLSVFNQDAFLQNLQAVAAFPQLEWNGNIGRTSYQKEDFIAVDRAIPAGCDFALGSGEVRWQNAAIPVYYDNTANPANWGARFGNILAALNTNYTGIDPSNGGSKAYTPDCVGGSAVGGNFTSFCDNNLNGQQSALIIFDDPCNEIADLSSCAGTLAFGGYYTNGNTHQFDGITWSNAIYGFVVLNNGTPGCLSDLQLEQVMEHELTHVYGMDHLDNGQFPNQNMNPFCCNAINTKDRECMNYAYPVPAPVELLLFEARLNGTGEVALQWVTESERENEGFTLQRSMNGIQYETIQEIASIGSHTGGRYKWLDTRPLAGVNYYLLSQTDFDGTVQNLGIEAVTVGKTTQILNISPNPAHGGILVLNMNLQDDFAGTLQVLDTDGRQILVEPLVLNQGAQQWQQPLGDIPAGAYVLRMFDGLQQWTARFLKQ